MAKKKTELIKGTVAITETPSAQSELLSDLDKDPKYSLEPDPTGALKLTAAQKRFITAYREYHNIAVASQFAEIDEKEGYKYFIDGPCRLEIRRINAAMYQRKFAKRLLTLDEIGGYLTSQLIDEDVALADRLSAPDKLRVVDKIIEINKLKAESFNNPKKIVEYVNIENDVKDLDAKDIKRLIAELNNPNPPADMTRKKELIDTLTAGRSIEESDIMYLKSCSVEELEKLVGELKNVQ